MHSSKQNKPTKLEHLPNIGKAIANDLRAIGIHYPHELAERDPLTIYNNLAGVMGHRHDPCVLYTLLSVKHFLETGDAVPWWNFTETGKKLVSKKQKSRP